MVETAGRPGPGKRRFLRPPGGEKIGHRRRHGPVGQDLPHQRLFHVYHLSQAGGMRPSPEHRDQHSLRGHRDSRRARQFYRHRGAGAPLHRPGQMHRLRRFKARLPNTCAQPVCGGRRLYICFSMKSRTCKYRMRESKYSCQRLGSPVTRCYLHQPFGAPVTTNSP